MLPAITMMCKDVDGHHRALHQHALKTAAEKSGDVLYLDGRGGIRRSLHMGVVLVLSALADFNA
jgi:hypothetical protein